MTFDTIDRQYKPKSDWVRLECANCGSDVDVQTMYPLWYNKQQKIPLCKRCAALRLPTAPDLIAQRDVLMHGIEEFVYGPGGKL